MQGPVEVAGPMDFLASREKEVSSAGGAGFEGEQRCWRAAVQGTGDGHT